MSINTFLVEDHDIVRNGIKALLKSQPDITIVGEASNGLEALEKLKYIQPDLLLMDMNMPVMDGLAGTRKIKAYFPAIKILVLSMHDHESYLIDMLEAGADGYILKNASTDELMFAIRKIANDGIYIGTEFTLNMLEKYKSSGGFILNNKSKLDLKISDREMDVLKLVAKGHTNNEIAKQLFTSVRTIETRRKNLLDKTKTTNTATLIHFATLNGIIR